MMPYGDISVPDHLPTQQIRLHRDNGFNWHLNDSTALAYEAVVHFLWLTRRIISHFTTTRSYYTCYLQNKFHKTRHEHFQQSITTTWLVC